MIKLVEQVDLDRTSLEIGLFPRLPRPAGDPYVHSRRILTCMAVSCLFIMARRLYARDSHADAQRFFRQENPTSH